MSYICHLFIYDRHRNSWQEASSCSTEKSRGVPGQEEIGSQPGECQPRRGTVYECCRLRNSRTLLRPQKEGGGEFYFYMGEGGGWLILHGGGGLGWL